MAIKKANKYDISNMVKVIKEYTDNTDLPILKEVCYQNDWNYDTVMKYQRDHEDLMQSIKNLVCKKEVELERGGLTGKYNNTMAIFSLKQLGWKDRQDEELLKDIEDLSTLADMLGFKKNE